MYLLWEIFFISITIALPIFSQRTAYQSIDEDYFKKYKIKKFGFLFKGMQGQYACSHGVILPMLIIQIQGYVLGLEKKRIIKKKNPHLHTHALFMTKKKKRHTLFLFLKAIQPVLKSKVMNN